MNNNSIPSRLFSILFVIIFFMSTNWNGNIQSVAAYQDSDVLSTLIMPEDGTIQITVNNTLSNTCDGKFGIESPGGPTELISGYNSYRGEVLSLADTYPTNTELIFYIEPGGYCAFDSEGNETHYLSTNSDHARILQIAYGIWRIDWEDLPDNSGSDGDFDDFIVTIRLSSAYPDEKQADETWADELYGNTQDSISNAGAALTNLTNLLILNGAHDADPSVLNSWLKTKNGFATNGKIIWGVTDRYKPGTDNLTILNYVKLITPENSTISFSDEIADSIAAYHPVLLQLDLENDQGSHFVLAVSRVETENGSGVYEYVIKDPSGTESDPGITRLDEGDSRIISARIFEPANQSTCSAISDFTVYGNPGIVMLLTDSMGRRVGTDGNTGISYREIPDSDVVYNPSDWFPSGEENPDLTGEGQEIYIPCTNLSQYQLEIFPLIDGEYNANIYYQDTSASVNKVISQTGNTNSSDIYYLDVDVDDPEILPEQYLYLSIILQ